MALTSGTKLGPYEIQSPLGAGGMGEVYRALDTRLQRTVAIKVLASHLSSSPELKQRMEREARAISSLNHPNICHLYDVGSHEGTDYLVMEFLEGETLADRLRRGAMPLNEIFKIGVAVADALGVAHRQGIHALSVLHRAASTVLRVYRCDTRLRLSHDLARHTTSTNRGASRSNTRPGALLRRSSATLARFRGAGTQSNRDFQAGDHPHRCAAGSSQPRKLVRLSADPHRPTCTRHRPSRR